MSVIQLDAYNFNKEVLETEETVAVDFGADWCVQCKVLTPILEEISIENPSLKIGKVNVEKEKQLADQYHIMTIPTLLIFQQGKIVRTSIGVKPKEEILHIIKENK